MGYLRDVGDSTFARELVSCYHARSTNSQFSLVADKEAIMNKSSSGVATSKYGLAVGTPSITSVGSLAFGPEGILFVADNLGATIFAIDTRDTSVVSEPRPADVEKIDTRLAAYLGCGREDVNIRDVAVHPSSQNIYLSVMRGRGATAIPVLVKVGMDGLLSDVSLEDVPFSQTAIENPATERVTGDRLWTLTVTDMAYVDGLLLVAGASNEEFSSTLRRIPFPFKGSALANSLEIFHVSHGRYETAAPIRSFVPYAGDTSVLASYTCTPVVHFSLRDIKGGTQLKGTTVAELGASNTPIDIVSFKRDGQEYVVVSNTQHGLIKIACKDIDRLESLTQPLEPVGVPRERLPHKGVGRMTNLNGSYVLMMQKDEQGNTDLRSYSTATL